MVLTFFLILFLCLVLYIFFIPIILVLDTANNQYYLHLKGLAKASILGDKEELIKIRLNVIFFNFYFYPLKKRKDKNKKELSSQKKEKKSKKRFNIRKGLKLLKSFQVENLYLDIDTGDYVLNAKIYPIFEFLKYYTKGNFNINFEGKTQMNLCLKNRPIYLIKSFINS